MEQLKYKPETERRGASHLMRGLAPREIKFRAWDMHRNVMCFNSQDGIHVGERTFEFKQILYNARFKVMQCTSLKDQDGKEIYEGDIIDWYGDKYVIIYDQEMAQFNHRALDSDRHDDYFELGNNKAQKVIGNIFETPELLP